MAGEVAGEGGRIDLGRSHPRVFEKDGARCDGFSFAHPSFLSHHFPFVCILKKNHHPHLPTTHQKSTKTIQYDDELAELRSTTVEGPRGRCGIGAQCQCGRRRIPQSRMSNELHVRSVPVADEADIGGRRRVGRIQRRRLCQLGESP